MNAHDQMNDIVSPLLRYYVPLARRDEHLAELLRTCERVGAREVSLFSSGYLGDAVFLDPAALEIESLPCLGYEFLVGEERPYEALSGH